MIEDNILTKKRFTTMIEECVHKMSMSYMDAIIHLCDQRGLDPSDVGKLISPAIKEKLEAECIGAKLIKSDTATLPI